MITSKGVANSGKDTLSVSCRT